VAVRLVALIVIPTTVAALLAGLRVSSAMNAAAAYQRVEQLSQLAGKTNALAHELEGERDLTAAYAATNADPRRRSAAERALLRRQQTTVDSAVSAVRTATADIDSSYPTVVQDRVRDIRNWLDGLPALREISTQTWLPPSGGIEKYSQVIETLLDLNDDVTSGITIPDLSATARAEAALARAKDQAAKEAALLHEVLIVGRFEPIELESIRLARAQRDSELAAFQASAAPAERQAYEDTVTGTEVDRAEQLRTQVVSRMTGSGSLSLRPVLDANDGERWSTYSSAVRDRTRVAERNLVDSIISRSGALKADARRSALIDAAFLFIVIFLVLIVTVAVARSLVRPLRKLRASALEVASNQLPGLVGRLRDPDAVASGLDVAPIDIDSTDEIGEVARAFDEVHREAVRLASNEAMLRGNVNAMFVNLSRRSQSLIERQLRLIDDLEQGEQDDKRLDSLFRLDHLATRMRRNCENLLVLGGQEQVRRWNQPVPMVDVVRAALSEVEQYDRIGVRIQGEVSIVGPVVNDLIHLAAELIENATVFSPEHTKVTISGHLLSGGGAMLQITDNGVGMSPQELEEANWRLANPPVVDVSVARRMGLFVVGRLATRHGIRIELRAALSGGITAFVLLPTRAVASDNGQSMVPSRFDMSGSEPAAAMSAPPAATGAPGGFDRDPAGLERALDRLSAFGGEPGLGSEQPGFGSEQPGRESWRPAAPQTGPLPAVSGHSGPQPAVEQTGSQPSAMERRTAGQPAVEWGTGAQPAVERDTGSFPALGRRTGAQPAVERHTGAQPAVERHTGAQPAVERHTGAQPAVERDTGSLPALGRHTGSQPAVGQTGPLPSLGRTGAQPAVGSWQDDTPVASPAASDPSADTLSGPPPAGASSGSGVSWEDGPPAAEPVRSTAGRSERSPIFEAMESEWFQRRTTAPSMRGAPKQASQAPQPSQRWKSPADDAWQAAEVVRKPASTGQTSVGLPKRVPGTNRVPGAVPSSSPAKSTPAAATPPASASPSPQSAETIRSRFTSLQRGVHRGRAQNRSDDDSSRTGETP
jgi:signal transduction histidine kinase